MGRILAALHGLPWVPFLPQETEACPSSLRSGAVCRKWTANSMGLPGLQGESSAFWGTLAARQRRSSSLPKVTHPCQPHPRPLLPYPPLTKAVGERQRVNSPQAGSPGAGQPVRGPRDRGVMDPVSAAVWSRCAQTQPASLALAHLCPCLPLFEFKQNVVNDLFPSCIQMPGLRGTPSRMPGFHN